jgi:hypothetical protein
MKDAISYVRVSSEEQADSGLGLEAERQRIAAYCTMKGLHLAEEFEDPGIRAGKPLASRPERRRPPRLACSVPPNEEAGRYPALSVCKRKCPSRPHCWGVYQGWNLVVIDKGAGGIATNPPNITLPACLGPPSIRVTEYIGCSLFGPRLPAAGKESTRCAEMAIIMRTPQQTTESAGAYPTH